MAKRRPSRPRLAGLDPDLLADCRLVPCPECFVAFDWSGQPRAGGVIRCPGCGFTAAVAHYALAGAAEGAGSLLADAAKLEGEAAELRTRAEKLLGVLPALRTAARKAGPVPSAWESVTGGLAGTIPPKYARDVYEAYRGLDAVPSLDSLADRANVARGTAIKGRSWLLANGWITETADGAVRLHAPGES
jgi:hypothetical protein